MIQCPNCRREAIESAVFCNHCGTQLQNICVSCDTFNSIDSNYCSRCGLSLSSEAQGEEYSAYQEPQRSSPVHSASCPRCHKVNEPGSAYCYSCGLPLDEGAISPQPSTTQSQRYYAQTHTEAQYPSQAYAKQPAGFSVRLVACLIDIIFLSVLIFVLLIVAYAFAEASSESSHYLNPSSDDDASLTVWLNIASYIVNTLYFAIGVAVWSTTIGKRIFRLYVVRHDGSKVGFGRALARWLCYFLSLLTLGIGFLIIAFRQDKRGLHDLICDTIVVKR